LKKRGIVGGTSHLTPTLGGNSDRGSNPEMKGERWRNGHSKKTQKSEQNSKNEETMTPKESIDKKRTGKSSPRRRRGTRGYKPRKT